MFNSILLNIYLFNLQKISYIQDKDYKKIKVVFIT